MQPPFSTASTSFDVILTTWVYLACTQRRTLSSDELNMSLLCITPCYFDARSAQYAKSLISSHFIVARMVRMSSDSNGIMRVGADGYNFIMNLVPPRRVSGKSVPSTVPDSHPFISIFVQHLLFFHRVLYCFVLVLPRLATLPRSWRVPQSP